MDISSRSDLLFVFGIVFLLGVAARCSVKRDLRMTIFMPSIFFFFFFVSTLYSIMFRGVGLHFSFFYSSIGVATAAVLGVLLFRVIIIRLE